MTRIIQISALSLVAACCFGVAGCSSSNDPTGTPTEPTAGAGNTTSQGGGGATGTGTAGATSIAGTSATVGGSGNAAAGSGNGAAGSAAAGAGNVAGGTSSSTFTPLCANLTTAGAVAPAKGIACTAADPQLCYKTCGPNDVGFKSETCMAGLYAEQSGCSFPDNLDASCYKIPATVDPSCPATAPMASDPAGCNVAACTLCSVSGMYLNSTGMSKPGYCVCPAADPANPTKLRKWSCASTTAWPCPDGEGCN
jgi:hypothetical protein